VTEGIHVETGRKPWEVFDQEIFPYLSFESLFGELEGLRQDGQFWQACCPVHRGSPGAFCINSRTLEWNCFLGCGGGGPVQYLQNTQGMSWAAAARELSLSAGLDPDLLEPWLESWSEEDFDHHGQLERRSSLLGIFMVYTRSLFRSAAGDTLRRDLMERYGFREDGLEKLDLGLYTVPEDLWHYLKKAGREMEEVRSWGLFDPVWSGCVLCSWRDFRGRHTNLWGWHPSRDPGQSAGRNGQLLFKGSGPLSGKALPFYLDIARDQKRFSLVLVVDPLDALLLRALDVEDPFPVATGGELSRAQIRSLEQHLELGGDLTLCLDYDPRAERARADKTLRTLERLRAARFPVYSIDPALLADSERPKHRVSVSGFLLRNGGGPAAVRAFSDLLETRECQAIPEESVTEPEPERRRVLDIVHTLSGRLSPGRQEGANFTESPHFWEPILRMADEIGRRVAGGFMSALPQGVVRGLTGGEMERMQLPATDEPAALAAASTPLPAFSTDRLEEETRDSPLEKPSGWKALDSSGAAFRPGELAVVGGRLAHGKTSILLGLLLEWLSRAGELERDEVFFFCSTGESEVRLFHRLLSLMAAKEGQGLTVQQVETHLRQAGAGQKEFDWSSIRSLDVARRKMKEWEGLLHLVYHPSGMLAEIEKNVRHLSQTSSVGAIFVDHVQALPVDDRVGAPMELSDTARRLKALAVELCCPVVVSAQLGGLTTPQATRIPVDRPFDSAEVQEVIRNRRPQIHDLRESGISQEADLVLGLLNFLTDYQMERPEAASSGSLTPLEVGILKNRYGSVGQWTALLFEPQFGLVRDSNSTEAAA